MQLLPFWPGRERLIVLPAFARLLNLPSAAVGLATLVSFGSLQGAAPLATATVFASSELTGPARPATGSVDGTFLPDGTALNLGGIWESSGIGFGSPQDDRAPQIGWDLGTTNQVTRIDVWNFSEASPAIKRAEIESSMDGLAYAPVREVALAGWSGVATPDHLAFVGLTARFIRLRVLETYGGDVFPVDPGTAVKGSYGFAGLSEVQFWGTLANPGPWVTVQPKSQSRLVGQTVQLIVAANGAGTLTSQWRRAGVNLSDGGDVSGANTATLTLANLQVAETGAYDVLITNSEGTTPSDPATLTVLTGTTAELLQRDLLVYLPFAGDARDTSGNNRNGLIQGATLTVDRLGNADSAYAFNGTAAITVGDLDPDSHALGFSFGYWVRPGNGQGAPALWVEDGGYGSIYFILTGRLRLGSGNPATVYEGVPSLPPGQWHHVFVTHDATFNRLYLDGEKVFEGASFPLQGNVPTLTLGGSYFGTFQGDMDEVAVFGRGLDPGEVLAIYQGILRPTPVPAPTITSQPQSMTVVAGDTANFTVTATGTAPLSYQWRKDGVPITDGGNVSGATTPALVLAKVQVTEAGSYEVVVGNAGGPTPSSAATLTVSPPPPGLPGMVDLSFDPGSAINGAIRAVAVQQDGKILIVGDFTSIPGAVRGRVARLNPDLTQDYTFMTSMAGADNSVNCVLVQPDGKVLIGGQFTNVQGVPRQGIARLNVDGSLDFGFNPGAGVSGGVAQAKSMAIQADGKILVWGNFTAVNGYPYTGLARLNGTGSLDTTFVPPFQYHLEDATFKYKDSIVVQKDGNIVIGLLVSPRLGYNTPPFYYGTNVLRLDTYGHSDPTFRLDDAFARAEHFFNYDVAVQADGKVLVGGPRIARLNSDGSVDKGFNAASGSDAVVALPDGKVLAQVGRKIVRLLSDGSLDNGFNAGAGADGDIYAMAVQTDGKVVIVGVFESVNGALRNRIARLNADGSLDTNSHPGSGINADVHVVVADLGGKVLIGGAFGIVGGASRNGIARLNADGSLDGGFTVGAGVSNANGDPAWVDALAVQLDGRVLIGGQFTSVNGEVHSGIARLNGDGGLDSTFKSQCLGRVYSVSVQPDGKILIGGHFSTVNGISLSGLARFDSDGSLDTGFNGGFSGDATILGIALQPGGQVLAVEEHACFRLNANSSAAGGFPIADYSLVRSIVVDPDGNLVFGYNDETGLHGGYSTVRPFYPDLTFPPGAGYEFAKSNMKCIARSPDGKLIIAGYFFRTTVSTPLVRVLRLNADFHPDNNFHQTLAGDAAETGPVSLAIQPDGKTIVGGGFGSVNGYPRTSLVRLLGNPPKPGIDAQPQSIIVTSGTTATFQVTASGVGPLAYQWRRNGVALPEGGRVSGTTSSILTLSNVQAADAASYDVVVGNAGVEATSQIATLKVQTPGPPNITGQPVSLTVNSGQDAVFSVTASGGAPLGYQWFFTPAGGGAAVAIASGTASTLTLVSAQLAQAGTYRVRVSNPVIPSGLYSATATLTVNTVAAGFVNRRLPGAYIPGKPFEVVLEANPGAMVAFYALAEHPPTGWIVSGINEGGSFDSRTGEVKFGPYADNASRTLRYTVLPPVTAAGLFAFSGVTSADGLASVPGGAGLIDSSVNHPADLNGDQQLSITEVTAYGAAWMRGAPWTLPPNPIPVDYVTRAGFLWRDGEAYRMDPSAGSAPLWWIPELPGLPGLHAGARLASDSDSTATRAITEHAVTLSITPGGAIVAYAVEERLAAGFNATGISLGGQFLPAQGLVRWGPFFDHQPRELTYTVGAPAGYDSDIAVSGSFSTDGVSLPVTGDSVIHFGTKALTPTVIPMFAGDRFQLEITGPINSRVVVESAGSLGDTWSAVTEFGLTKPSQSWSAPVVLQQTDLFFRVRILSP